MALGFSFGGEKSSTSLNKTESGTQKQTGTETTSGTVSTSGGQTSTQQQQSSISTLDEETQGALSALLADIASNIGGGPASEIADLLFSRAKEGASSLQEQNAAIIESERLRGQRELEQGFTKKAAAAGSSFNTLVQAATARESGEESVRLAGLEGELNLNARDKITGELTASLQGVLAASGQPIAQITSLANALKGATTTGETATTGEATSEQSQITDLTKQLASFLESQSTTVGTSKSSGMNFGISG